MAEGTRGQENRKFEETIRNLLKEQREQFERELEAIKSLVLEVCSQRSPGQQESPRNSKDEYTGSRGGSYQTPTRFSRIEFPKFGGVDFKSWSYKCDQFFEIDETPSETKVRIAAMHLEDKALQWHQVFMKARISRDPPSWEEYVRALGARFGDCLYDDPMGDLKSLKQTRTVKEYQDSFEELLNRVALPEQYAVSCFIRGLREEIQLSVRMFMPRDLQHAVGLAKIEEAKILNAWKNNKHPGSSRMLTPYSPNVGPSNSFARQSNLNNTPILPKPGEQGGRNVGEQRRNSRFLSTAEMDEKRAKGLCYWCNERYSPGHQCKRRQLFRIECVEEETEEQEPECLEEDEQEVLTEGNLAQISTSAMCSLLVPNFRTMRIHGQIERKTFSILIDCGSSHNFLHPNMVRKFGLRTVQVAPVKVVVADGNSLTTTTLCPGFQWRMQGQAFEGDILVLPVGGCEVVLGMQWLTTLGDVKWNFAELRMEFDQKGKKAVLRGTRQQPVQVVSKKQMQKLLSKPEQIETAQLCLVTAENDYKEVEVTADCASMEREVKVTPYKHQLELLLTNYNEVFEEPMILPPARMHDHRIYLKEGTQPINVRPYRYPAFQKGEIERLVTEMLDNGVIRPSNSPFSSPVVLVKKKDGTWRMCVDYRELNKATVKDKFPIPLVEELFDELFGAVIFTKLDLRSGYHQIRMHLDDVAKTAFRTHDGHYEFLVMPFGLTNAPSTFQSLMNDIFRPFLRKFLLVFFDDILIYSKSGEEHIQHLTTVFETLLKHQLKVKKNKCSFAADKIEYLGHVISAEGVSADPQKLVSIQQWPTPVTIKELRGFLGLTGYYRRFIKGYGMIARPLTDLLKKNAFAWHDGATAAFDQLKLAMTSPPVLTLPDFSQEFVVETDASNSGIGAVLLQHGRPLAFFSKALAPKHQGLSVYEKEMLAIVNAIQKWRPYLLGGHFIIKTDHQSLKYLMEQKISTPS
ncbi:uncharacterized protein [Coffea arabica]|uniref:Reverse transcriptase domain-containing protein n=1 Tax=Coffea arabica TaxID=13443 RepID=A0ABM4V340_COFAR